MWFTDHTQVMRYSTGMRKSIEREQAIMEGRPRYFTGRPCRHGHIAERMTSNHTCVECDRVKSAESHVKFRASRLTKQAERRSLRLPGDRAAIARWYRENTALSKSRASAWNKAHPWMSRASWARYNARKLQATPEWRNDAAITEIYRARDAAQELFGVSVHVDHIVPLDGGRVCGLHVETNLRLMPGPENSSKGNRYWPDMW